MIIVHFGTVSLFPNALMSPYVLWESLARFEHATIYLQHIRILQHNRINIFVSPATTRPSKHILNAGFYLDDVFELNLQSGRQGRRHRYIQRAFAHHSLHTLVIIYCQHCQHARVLLRTDLCGSKASFLLNPPSNALKTRGHRY